ncbi:sigma-70 family RNA polymerase sigma factor [uncultured Kordia sp.]|uniref:RNA polymerase sigma factor n=1 Tax=uncultured Kordia sp. TaxID=507699 RepID=UPI00260FEA9D|nr:sigma-70 family RNA polymerase sigma factor [uncultured Kordia sp.]
MNEKKFISIIETHKNLIFKVCNSYCNSNEYKDLEQEILIQIWNSFDRYDGRVKISTWIYKIALNTAISYYRKGLVEKKRTSTIHESVVTFSEYNFELDEQIKLLYKFIEKLHYLEKAIILLYLDNYTYKEISEIIGFSKTNISTKINRIKIKLRKDFTQKK